MKSARRHKLWQMNNSLRVWLHEVNKLGARHSMFEAREAGRQADGLFESLLTQSFSN
jgi:hypothetical protein